MAMLFTASPWWLIWDNRVLTEALTLSAIALFAAGAMIWVKGRGPTPMLTGAAIALLARPLTIPLVFVVLIIALIARRGIPRPIAVWASIAGLVAFAAFQSIAFNQAPVTYTYLPAPTTMEAVRAADRYVSRSHLDGYQRLAEQRNIPACIIAADIPPGATGLTPLWTNTCPEAITWLENGGVPWHDELLQNTMPTIREMISGRWIVVAWAGYSQIDPHWDAIQEKAPNLWRPAAGLINILMWLILAISSLWLLRNGPNWGYRAGFTIAALGYAGSLWMFDGLEMWRHILSALVGLFPAALASINLDQAQIVHPKKAAGYEVL
ncbi:hypothetical protein [Neomicrococcus lactis]|uniref:hypothetical protein n=1 Tax=Neomicrococcus lactis TaxID=732241 RepID=UPI0023010AEB|nr:hypothetical protein [Neomicrococcus lactis]